MFVVEMQLLNHVLTTVWTTKYLNEDQRIMCHGGIGAIIIIITIEL